MWADAMLTALVCSAVACAVVWLAALAGSKAARRVAGMQTKWARGAAYLATSKDKSWSLKNVPENLGKADLDDPALVVKTVVFFRHGESFWNQVFNRGFGPSFPLRLVYGILRELHEITMGNSLFIDSPLSYLGEDQCEDVCSFLRSQSMKSALSESVPALEKTSSLARTLQFGSKDSRVVSSNLRRSMGTAVIGLRDRLVRTGEKVQMLSCLQEITRNVDALSLSRAKGVQENLGGRLHAVDARELFRTEANLGNKTATETGLKRIVTFSGWLFDQDARVVVAAGHSLYFRSFFQVFLPRSFEHVAKKKKMRNCGLVAFDIARDSKGGTQIVPTSIHPVYLGFCK